MKQITILLTLTLAMLATAASALTGTWRNYLAYSDITDVQQAGNTLFVLASGGLYSYNTTDQSITTYDKTNGLSSCGISRIAWCQEAGRLVAVYSNGNIDLVNRNGNVVNMPEYYNYSTTADKTIYGLDVIGRHAYLSTGFGIVNINVADANVAETYNLGFRVDYVYTDDSRIYAASSTNGIYSAPLTANLLDPANWTYTAPYTARQHTVDPELLATAQTLNPGGPKRNWFGYMIFKYSRLYTSGGGWQTNGEFMRPGCVQVLENNEWNIYQDDFTLPNGVTYLDATSIAVDPNDPSHVFTGNAHCGLIEFMDGRYVENYSIHNSPMHASASDNTGQERPSYVRVDGLEYYGDNLYMLNSSSVNVLLEFSPDKEWTTHNNEELMRSDGSGYGRNGLRGTFTDSRGLMWIVNSDWTDPTFHYYQPTTGEAKTFVPEYNQNGTNINITRIKCISEDHEGNLWIGTNVGPIILSQQHIDSENPVYTQFIVPRNDGTNLGDYLLANIDINSIAIDGAGRKWFGTNGNGVYLISEDNLEQVEHFTSANSPLLSDIVESIAIDDETGEVYIGTDQGLCSYTSDATAPAAEMTKDNVYAYPNPVRPDYTGPITIVGLTYDADVKITTVNGTLVAEGRSTGGSFQWDGCDMNGRRVASGVYMVQTATSTGDKGTVCKIAIVN